MVVIVWWCVGGDGGIVHLVCLVIEWVVIGRWCVGGGSDLSTTNVDGVLPDHGPATSWSLLPLAARGYHPHTMIGHYHHPHTITLSPRHSPYRNTAPIRAHHHTIATHTITTHTPSHYHHPHYHHPHTTTLSPPSPPTHHHTITTITTLSPPTHYHHHHHTYRIENIGNQPVQTLYRRQESAEQRYH